MEALGDSVKLSDPKQVARLIDSYLLVPSPQLRDQIIRLNPYQLPQIVVLGKGTQRLANGVGDSVTTSRFLREGGADLAAAAGLYGDEIVDYAIRIDALLRSGKLVTPPGYRNPNLQDFGKLIVDGGEAGWKFYTGYVRPNWREWAAGGALAVYLVNPELFFDGVGKISEKGLTLVTQLGGAALAGALQGIGKGSEDGAKAVKFAISDYFLNGWTSVPAYIGLGAALLLCGLCFRRVRRWLLAPFRWLNRA